jgi:hypothetical protein
MRKVSNALSVVLVVAVLLVTSEFIFSQFPKIPKIIPDKIPGVEDIIKKESPITNKLSDAVTEVPFLDDFNPRVKIPMTALPRTSEGAFVIKYPGSFVFICQSYCLHAGAYEPGKGDGYLYAPVKGPQAEIFRHIMQRSYEHSEVLQRDIQVLLWAILARAKISDMADELQVVASKLLTPKEIFEINGGALELVPKSALDKATVDMPPQVRRVMEAEAGLRNKLSAGEQKYEELEEIAVRHGVPPIGEGSRNVPRGRWSYREEGYFVRYFPYSYQMTLIELYAPFPIEIERDDKGRITLIADEFGNRIETEYDENIGPMTIPGESSLKGYAFSSIRIERNDPEDPEKKKIHLEWKNTGWTLCGVPGGEGKIGSSSARFPGLEERYKWTKKHKKELDYIDKQFTPTGSYEEVMNLGNYALALKEAVGYDLSQREEWKKCKMLNLVKNAWASAVSKRERGYIWGCAPKKRIEEYMFASLFPLLYIFTTGSEEKPPEYDPSGDIAQPVNTSNQRLMQSPNPSSCLDVANNDLAKAIDKCYAQYSSSGKGYCNRKLIYEWEFRNSYYGGTKRKEVIAINCRSTGEGYNTQKKENQIKKCIDDALWEYSLALDFCISVPMGSEHE